MLNILATLLSIALIAAIILAALGVMAWAFNLLVAVFAPPAPDAEIATALAQVAQEQAEVDAELAISRHRATR